MKRFFSGIAFLLLIAGGCKKDDKLSGPEIKTVSVTALSPTAVVFSGNIASKGSYKVLDYGFIYSNNGIVDEHNGTKVSLGSSAGEGAFSTTVNNLRFDNNYGYPNTVYVRAYIRDEKGTAFGAMISTGLPSPSAGNIVPASGRSGEVVKITGKFYNPELQDVRVTFQNVNANVIAAGDTEISAEIPSGISVPHGYQISISVLIGNIPVVVAGNFTILANVKDYTPKLGPIGTPITFTGDNLLAEYGNGSAFTVYFGDKPASIVYGYQMQAQVPSGISGKVPVSIAYNGQKIALPGEFTILDPIIASVTPETVMPGMTLTISGGNLPNQQNPYENNPSARLGDAPYEPASYDYQGNYAFVVPPDTPEGSYTLTLRLGNTELTAPKKITVKAYSATSFSPKTGAPGAELNIKGNFIKDTWYTVYFGTVSVGALATSATNLLVNVPTGINAGKPKLSVDVPGKRLVLPGDFELKGPSVTSFSPASGVAGTIITIKGSGFFTGDYWTTVKFGTVAIQAISVTENTITVAVPSNLSLGAMKLSIVTGGQEVMAEGNFTATN